MSVTRTSLFSRIFRRTPKTIRRSNPVTRAQLGLTALESREVPAYLSGGSLMIVGTNAVDTVTVSQTAPANWWEVSKVQVVHNGVAQTFSASLIRSGEVYFYGGGGNDSFQNSAYLSAIADGGAGADVLSGGPMNDRLTGGTNNDAIYGNGGNDTLRGGQGNDEMRGGGDNDTLYGDGDNDTMRGGPGHDSVYGNDGNDTMYGDNNAGTAGGVGNDTLVGGEGIDYLNGEGGHDALIAIDSGLGDTVIAGNAWHDPSGWDTVWMDDYGVFGTDYVYGADAAQDVVHGVREFRNGADRTFNGDNIADPDATIDPFGNMIGENYQNFAGRPLFANAGPTNLDVTQQNRGDCWMMATAAAVANDNPQEIRHMVADAGDGTYLVKLGDHFYRVDADLPTWSGAGDLRNAGLGVQDSMWVGVVEKAYAHFRTDGANHSYWSLDSGNPADAARAFGLTDVGQQSYGVIDTVDGLGVVTSTDVRFSSAELGDEIRTRFNLIGNVTICTDGALPNGTTLSANHCWAVTGFDTDAEGNVTTVRLRNPWGSNLTVSVADMFDAGVWVTWGSA